MGFVNDLENQVREYLTGDYEVEEVKAIPSVEDVAFGKKSKKMKLCAFSIDLRKSSDLLFKHRKQTSGKIHKAFLTIVAKTIKKYGGEIRSFQGDCILAFWSAFYKKDINNAVKAAMVTTWLLKERLSKHFEKYEKLDFGIGIDRSDVSIVRAGISRDANNNDLVFIGECVNFATAIANQTKSPFNIGISLDIYNNLKDDLKFYFKLASESDQFWRWYKICEKNGRKYLKVNMWKDGRIYWNDKNYNCKITYYYWET